MYTPASALFRRPPLVSQRVAIPPVRFCFFSVAILTFLRFPVCLSEVFRLVSNAGRRLLPPSRRGNYPGSVLAPHSSSTLIYFSLFALFGAIGSPEYLGDRYFWAWLLEARLASRGAA
jgi:hypothetical protein